MAVAPRLELRQSQTLVMTPQLQQAIKLLQLSNIELTAYVEQEMEKNPLLERMDSAEGVSGLNTEPSAGAGGEAESPLLNGSEFNGELSSSSITPGEAPLALDNAAPSAASEAMDVEYDNTFTNGSAADSDNAGQEPGGNTPYEGRPGSHRFDDSEFGLEQTLSTSVTLREHLQNQLHMLTTDPVERMIGAHLIGLVDQSGYMSEPLDDVAAQLGAPLEQVSAVLTRLQRFEPTGVFARSLSECLELQLAERDRLDPAMQALVNNLELLARRELNQLMRLCGVDAEDITDMIQELKALNPKPGLAFEHEITQTVVPDVFVRRQADGGWTVELNSDTLPRVLINTRYHARISGSTKNKVDKSYLSECLNSANWLVKSLDQRANTILKVATEIVRQQDAFFAHGVRHLRPLNLRAIAEAISMHESTVSRVTANKYMATPRGIFELKYFFTASIAASGGGDAHSAEAVRDRIRTMIDNESIDDVLSDDKIVEILLASGVDIARRTVAKYRDAMRIPSSVQRRRLKKIAS